VSSISYVPGAAVHGYETKLSAGLQLQDRERNTICAQGCYRLTNSTIHKEKSNKMQQCIKIFIIPYLCEAQSVLGDTPPIISSLKLHWQSLVFYTWNWWMLSGTLSLTTSTNSMYEKPEAASAVLGSC